MGFEDGDYRATELLGAGGSAQVWAGVQVSTGRPVAIKVFAPDRLAAAVREAALASAVDHSHLVSVIDVIGSADRAMLVTELAIGGDLADLLDRRGQLTAGETLTVLLPMAAALATAHERQIVHGDLSARNIVFDRAGRPLLADLGAARAAAELSLPVATTPVDAAPELARGGAPTPASDMFSLGSLGLACLTGRHAWPAEDLRDVLIQAAAGQWPDPPDAAGPPELIAVIRGLLEHDPERRPGAAAVVVDLRAAGRPEPIDLRPGSICRLRASPCRRVGARRRAGRRKRGEFNPPGADRRRSPRQTGDRRFRGPLWARRRIRAAGHGAHPSAAGRRPASRAAPRRKLVGVAADPPLAQNRAFDGSASTLFVHPDGSDRCDHRCLPCCRAGRRTGRAPVGPLGSRRSGCAGSCRCHNQRRVERGRVPIAGAGTRTVIGDCRRAEQSAGPGVVIPSRDRWGTGFAQCAAQGADYYSADRRHAFAGVEHQLDDDDSFARRCEIARPDGT